MYEDKTLICNTCGNEFVFTAGEQEFYAEKGLANDPKHCKECRAARKNAKNNSKVEFVGVCAACGGEAKVKFTPKDGRPIYCSTCFEKNKAE